MKRQYDGLEAVKIELDGSEVIATSGNCVAMIQLELDNGVCVTDPMFQQIEYVGNKG